MLAALLSLPAGASHEPPANPAETDIEKLLELEVYTASRFPQPRAQAPSTLTVITADEIRLFGFRTLDEILRSVPGVHISSDRIYEYIGIRGIRRPQDFNSAVLLLVDGQRLNDGIYDTASIGNDFPVDVELIERVEFVRGPGSSVYGSNALLGTINVITRDPRKLQGHALNLETGDAGYRRALARSSFGVGGDSALMLAASYGNRDGGSLHLPAFDDPSTNNGRVDGRDGDRWRRLMASAQSGDWRLHLVHSERNKEVPVPIYGSDFNDRHGIYSDTQGFANLSYDTEIDSDWSLRARIFHAHYAFDGDLNYSGVLNRDKARTARAGLEAQVQYRGWHHHRLIAGYEGGEDYRQEQLNFDVDPYFVYLDRRDQIHPRGLFFQDEWQAHPRLTVTAGLRFDQREEVEDVTSPRLALVMRPVDGHTLKLLYGEAFRAPSRYERYYSAAGYSPNPDIEPEHTRNWDLLWEAFPTPTFRMQLGLQHFDIRGFIVERVEPETGNLQYQNSKGVHSNSVDLDLEKFWPNQVQTRLSLSLQEATRRDSGLEMLDSPNLLAKLYAIAPLPRTQARLALEVLGQSERRSLGRQAQPYVIANLTLSGLQLRPGLSLNASVYNIGDVGYEDPVSSDLADQGIDTLEQLGREFRVGLDWAF